MNWKAAAYGLGAVVSFWGAAYGLTQSVEVATRAALYIAAGSSTIICLMLAGWEVMDQ